jgi:hypothetical protein
MSYRRHVLLVSILIVVGALAVPIWDGNAAGLQEQANLIVTTADLHQEYEIVGVIVIYQEASAFSFKGDPVENAIKKGQETLFDKAKAMKADAVVGYRIEFASRTQKDEGRVLVYGTAVRLKK